MEMNDVSYGNLKTIIISPAGNINIIAIIFGVIFTVVAVVILISFICLSRHRARYYTHEDKLSGKSIVSHIIAMMLNDVYNFSYIAHHIVL